MSSDGQRGGEGGASSAPASPSHRRRAISLGAKGEVRREVQRLRQGDVLPNPTNGQSIGPVGIDSQNSGQMPQAGPPPPAQVAHAQHIQQQREILQQHQLAALRAKEPTDLNMPEGIEDINPLIGELVHQYKRLQEGERKLDMIMQRKRLEMQDRYNRPERREGVLRISIHNTYENQPWQQDIPDNFTYEDIKDPEYAIWIRAELLSEDGDMSDDEAEEMKTKVVEKEDEIQKDKKRFSNFFHRITIERENPNGENVNIADWKKGTGGIDSFDHLKIKRTGDTKFNVVINLHREEHPDRYRLSHALTSTVDHEEGSRADVLYWLFEYIKLFGLQDDDEKRTIRCDSNLKAIFGVDMVYFPQVPEMIIQHLHPLPPYQLRYTVHLDKEYTGIQTIYDVRVQVEDPICAMIYAMTHSKVNAERNRKIAECDKKLARMVQYLHRSMGRHAFFKEFSMDPQGFCRKWLVSQQRDLRIMLGERAGISGAVDFERGGEGSVWSSDAIKAAVQDMLAKDDAREAAKKA